MTDIPKAYEPPLYEDDIYRRWEQSGFFTPENLPDFTARAPFTIVVPPPNATGTLHIGHAAMLAIEDALVRFHRMNGRRALWVPGTDHAALATQNKVEKDIFAAEKKTRHDLGRAELVRRIEEFVESKRDRIKFQFRKMGSSLDWSRECFTLDEPRSLAVRTMFKKMYDDGLIYRGNRVVNWCARCASTLSDDEVESKTRTATLYYFKYAKNFPLTIASTQPETKLGDAAVAVHPSDERYADLIGQVIEVPFGGAGGVQLSIKIIGDHTVEKDFGTGALGVTPAHSMVDYLMALQHELPLHHIMGEDGLMTELAGPAYAHQTTHRARELVVAWLRAENLIEKEEEIEHNVPICSRCETEIIPLPKLQWFVGVNKNFAFTQSVRHPIVGWEDGAAVTLKDTMRHVVATKQINIIPDRFEKTYFHWIDNLRDWCISRQIWYGHRIPVYYCVNGEANENSPRALSERQRVAQQEFTCASPFVSIDTPECCPCCGGQLEQDSDVLDTWFSAGAWTFSTLGWPYTKVIFVRHGEAMSNIKGILDSETNDPENGLTAAGKKTTHDCAASLTREHASIIFSSPIRRTKETAEILSPALGIEIKFDERIREIGSGELEGKTIKKFLAARGPLNNWYSDSPHGIESFMHMKARLISFMEDLLKEYRGRTVIVVTHGNVIGLLKDYGAAGATDIEAYPRNACALVREFDAAGSQIGDLQIYHPTDVLETGYDILFNWVARMILLTTYAVGEVPFRTVYLHGLVRDHLGRKMSKSLGNVIDPLDVIPKFGTDAVRLSLLLGSSPGNDIRMSEEKIAGFRNFTNKLWNISRFVMTQEAAPERRLYTREDIDALPLTTLDQWILSRLAEVTQEVTTSFAQYDLARAGEILRDFTWNELADWYLECAKVEGGKVTLLHFLLQHLLRLWHPFMPFVTEVIWQEAYAANAQDFLMVAPWPHHTDLARYPQAEEKFLRVQRTVTAIRTMRSLHGIPAGEIIPITIITKHKNDLALFEPVIEKLARGKILFADAAPDGQIATVTDDATITMPQPTAHASDERATLELERHRLEHYAAQLKEKLENQEFLARAPVAIVQQERAKQTQAQEKLDAIKKRLA